MSVQAMSWALVQQMVTESHARHVLLCLANYADQTGRSAFPAIATLARDTGLSSRTVQYRLRELEEAGVIRRGNQAIPAAYIDQRDRLPVCYDIDLSRGAPCAPGARHDGTGCTPEHNGVHPTTERGAQRAPNPPITTIEPSITVKEGADASQAGKSKGSKFDPLTAKPANASEQAWADFCEMRKAKRAPLTRKACENIAKKLMNHADPDAVLDRSTTNSWSDVYPESGTPGAGSRSVKPSRHTGLSQIDHKANLGEMNADGSYRI